MSLSFVFLFCLFLVGIDVVVRSEGCEDPHLSKVHCGLAYIKVNGGDYALKKRGFNVVLVDYRAGMTNILSLVSFLILC